MGSDFTVIINEYMPLRELVFTTLRQAILKGELQPGERLMEIQLAEKMGVSRTPIREAIRKLAAEGLVTMLKDVLHVRMTLEKMAYEGAFENITDQAIEELRAAEAEFETAVDSGDLVSIAEADEKFHFIIYNAAGNDKLREILTSLKENMYRYRMEYAKNRDVRSELIEDHRAIVATLADRDAENGLKLVEKHISNQEKAVLAKLKEEAQDNSRK